MIIDQIDWALKHFDKNSGWAYMLLRNAPQLGNKNNNNGGGVVSGAVTPYCGFHLWGSKMWTVEGVVRLSLAAVRKHVSFDAKPE